jgi:hypothetical protein
MGALWGHRIRKRGRVGRISGDQAKRAAVRAEGNT